MVLELTPRTVVLIIYNYVTYLLNDQRYQQSIIETSNQFTSALYNDLISMLWVQELPE